LAIVKHILNRHRGSMRVESIPGESTIFTVTLPLQQSVIADNQ
ncbi:MAG: two-component sensor histidine kinase, partial [Candidatus Puniceispirillum sp.]